MIGPHNVRSYLLRRFYYFDFLVVCNLWHLVVCYSGNVLLLTAAENAVCNFAFSKITSSIVYKNLYWWVWCDVNLNQIVGG